MSAIEGTEGVDARSWFCSTCKICGYNVVVTRPDPITHPTSDYWWYCSNKKCEHHHPGSHTGDMEAPSWVTKNISWVIKNTSPNLFQYSRGHRCRRCNNYLDPGSFICIDCGWDNNEYTGS